MKMKKALTKITALSAVLLASAGFSQITSASTVEIIDAPVTQLGLTINGSVINLKFEDAPLRQQENGGYSLSGVSENADFGITWDVEYRSNPYLFSNLTLTNFTSSTSTYNIEIDSPAASTTATKGGSVGYTLTDENGDGTATLASVGSNPLYKAFVDGTQELQLMGVSDTCTSINCISSGSATDGVSSLVTTSDLKPVATSLAFTDGVATELGITLDFTLSAGDKVNFESYFQVTPVPVPAAGWLMMTGLGLLAARKRKSISA